jgi:hypothetical protein
MNAWTDHWPIILGAFFGVFLVVSLVQRLRAPTRKRVAVDRMKAEAADPLKAWVQCAFLIVTGDCDYGHLAPGDGRRMLQRWWNIHGVRDHSDTLDDLAAAPDNAWDLVRFVLVVRMGVAAGYLSDDEGWEEIRPIAARLRNAYDGWAALGQAYLTARRQWQGVALDGTEDDPTMRRIVDNIEELRATRWLEVPYDLEFEVTA